MDLSSVDFTKIADNGFAVLVALLLLKFMFNDMKHIQSGLESINSSMESTNRVLRAVLRLQAKQCGDDPDMIEAEIEAQE